MDYDPIKDRLGTLFNRSHASQHLFYRILDTVFLRAWYVQRELKRILRALDQVGTIEVLDAGTGFGQYAYHLVRRHDRVRVDAVDVKEDYLQNARRFMERTPFSERVSFRQADLTRLDAVEAYHLVLSVDVMEHIEEDELVFANFARALRPGGYVLINTPSDLGGSDVDDEGAEGFIGEHVRNGYNRAELEEKLERAGFEIDRSLYTYGKPGSMAWRLLVKYPMKMLSSNRASLLLLPLYYLPVLPVGMLLNAADLRETHDAGTGVIVVARKPTVQPK